MDHLDSMYGSGYQRELLFHDDAVAKAKSSANRTVCDQIKVLITHEWCTPYEIMRSLSGHRLMSESAITARIRDLRKPQFGGYTVISRPRKNHTAWEYTIPKESK